MKWRVFIAHPVELITSSALELHVHPVVVGLLANLSFWINLLDHSVSHISV